MGDLNATNTLRYDSRDGEQLCRPRLPQPAHTIGHRTSGQILFTGMPCPCPSGQAGGKRAGHGGGGLRIGQRARPAAGSFLDGADAPRHALEGRAGAELPMRAWERTTPWFAKSPYTTHGIAPIEFRADGSRVPILPADPARLEQSSDDRA